jgi:type IV pilus assembly protein PilQ
MFRSKRDSRFEWKARRIGAAFLALAVGTAAWAQDNQAKQEPAGPDMSATLGRVSQDINDTRITLNVKDYPLADVVSYIRDQAKINIILAQDVELNTKVTAQLDRVPWREALKIIVDKAACVIIRKADNLYVIEQPERITWKFQSSPITSVIESIAKISGASIVVAPEVQGNVHLTLTNVPWRTALDTVAKSLGFVVVEEDWGILQVVHPSKLKEQLETRSFKLRYARPPAAYRPAIKTEYAVGKPKAPTEDPEKDFSLLKALRSALTENGKLEYIDKHNVIVVRDTAPVLTQIERLISEIDIEPAQVFVDIKFVTTTNSDALSYGVDIGDTGIAAGLTGSAIPSRLPFTIGSDGLDVLPDGTTADGDPSIGLPGLTPDEIKSATTFGRLDFTQTSFTLKLLAQDQKSRIVQAPKLIALDNQEATIFVGRTVRFAQTEAVEGQSGGLTFTIKEAANSPVQTGFQLFIVPHVIPGTNKVMMTVIPEAEQLVGTSTDPNVPRGFDKFSSGEGTANEVSIALPQIASSTLVTSMMLETGETAVIGGLITESDTTKVNKVPILGDIQILGFFFRHEESTKSRESLLIFITPKIIRDSDVVESLIREEETHRRERIEKEVERIFDASGTTEEN